MEDFSCQANTVKKKTISRGNQVGAPVACFDAQTQIGDWKGSYGRCEDDHSGMNYNRKSF